MDYSKLSDAELDAQFAKLSGGTPPPGAPVKKNYQTMTDAELDQELASRHQGKTSDVVQEMHPELTVADRMVVGNFSANNEAAVNYLQKRHPNLEIKVGDDDQILARARNGSEPQYRVLNPTLDMASTGSLWGDVKRGAGEAAMDVGGNLYGLASGAATGIASAAGGLAGGAASGGALAVPSAMAAGAGASGGLEGLRQAIGKHLGIEQEYDPAQMGYAAAGGVAAPLLLGTGGNVKGKLASAIAEMAPNIGMEDLEQASQRGLIGRLYDAVGKPVATKAGALLSGVTPDSVKTLGTKLKTLLSMEGEKEPVTRLVQSTAQDAFDKIKDVERNKYGEFLDAVKNAGKVDVSDVAQPLREGLNAAKAEADEVGTESSKQLYGKLQEMYQKLFNRTVKTTEAGGQVPSGVLDAAGNMIMKEGEPVERLIAKPLSEMTVEHAANLEQELGMLAEHGSFSPRNMGHDGRYADMTPAERKVSLIASRMKEGMKEVIDGAVGPEAMASREAYAEAANTRREIAPLLNDPQKAFASLRNADNTPNLTRAELFQKSDRVFGTNLVDAAKTAKMYADFHKPSDMALSRGGSSLARAGVGSILGGAAGAFVGEKTPVGRHGGAALGAIAGAAGGSPAMLRRYLQTAVAAREGLNAAGPLLPAIGSKYLQQPAGSAAQNLWLKMGGQ